MASHFPGTGTGSAGRSSCAGEGAAALGLTTAEKRENKAVQQANDDFRNLRKFARNRLVIVLWKGHLEMGYALSNVNLDIDETFEVRWWVNKNEAGKPKVDCNQPSDFLRGFQQDQDASLKIP